MKNSQIRSYQDNTFRKLPDINSDIWCSKEPVRILARKLASKAFSNIDDFPYIYFTNGITEAINYLAVTNKLKILPAEYRYLRLFPNVSELSGNSIYLSYPYSGNGKFYAIPRNAPVILDCAYIFASNMQHEAMLPDNVTHVLFSLSKSHNLPDYRLGWMFSRKPIQNYHILQYEYDYTVSLNFKNALELANVYEANFLYNKYRETLSTLYRENCLIEYDTNLFATNKEGLRFPWYTLPGTLQN